MRIHSRCSRAIVPLVLVVLTVFSNRGRAESVERIRTESGLLATVVETGIERSASFRSLVERIEQSDVLVHLTCDRFKSGTLAGRTLLASAGPDVRYLRVQINCQQSDPALVSVVGHELQHVVEIASAPSVVDDKSFTRLFRTIGFSTCVGSEPDRFETAAALAAGERVRAEYFHHPETSVQARPRIAARVTERSGD
jgi:hypothetical protein